MTNTFAILLGFLIPALLGAQTSAGVDVGKAVFRSNCAFCHGLDARGGRGPNLVSQPLTHGDSDEAIRRVVQKGIPGSTMPAFKLEKDELDALMIFLHRLMGTATRKVAMTGNAERGRQVYLKNGCSGCHQIGSEGSVFGPDLSRIGAARSLEYLRESIVHPSADIPEDHEGVTVVTKAGKQHRGVRVNEDTFTVQIREPSQAFLTFQKDQLQQVKNETKSLMPAYASLSPDDLNSLLSYLVSLRMQKEVTGAVKAAQGIK